MSEKIENILNMALDINTSELLKSRELSAGYIPEDNSWDLIIRYSGNLDFLNDFENTSVVDLLGNYAIVTIPERLIERLAQNEQVIFIEKPKPLYFSVLNGARVSCINSFQQSGDLYGDGVIVAVIDSGIDYSNRVFRNQDGTTRILEIWDQSDDSGTPPKGYTMGSLYTDEMIDRALMAPTVALRNEIVPSRDLSGHGTHVAGIAAGNFASDKNNNLGIATKSKLIVVKLANVVKNSFPRTVELMEGIDYVVKRAAYYNRPVAINLSFGNTYGSHEPYSVM